MCFQGSVLHKPDGTVKVENQTVEEGVREERRSADLRKRDSEAALKALQDDLKEGDDEDLDETVSKEADAAAAAGEGKRGKRKGKGKKKSHKEMHAGWR